MWSSYWSKVFNGLQNKDKDKTNFVSFIAAIRGLDSVSEFIVSKTHECYENNLSPDDSIEYLYKELKDKAVNLGYKFH
jgi:hypothetical protein